MKINLPFETWNLFNREEKGEVDEKRLRKEEKKKIKIKISNLAHLIKKSNIQFSHKLKHSNPIFHCIYTYIYIYLTIFDLPINHSLETSLVNTLQRQLESRRVRQLDKPWSRLPWDFSERYQLRKNHRERRRWHASDKHPSFATYRQRLNAVLYL